MNLTYARIADRVVADQYNKISSTIDTLSTPTHHDCSTRPVELGCRLESACETCAYFATGPEFIPVQLRQRDYARDHQQNQTASPSSTTSSTEPNHALDTDHPYNGAYATAAWLRPW